MQKTEKINPLDKKKIGIGVGIPLEASDTSFFELNYSSAEQIKDNFRNLILTNPGERYMQPTFGCGISKFLFESDEYIEEKIKNVILEQTKAWLPEVDVRDVFVVRDENRQELIDVRIVYSVYPDLMSIETLDLNFTV